MGMSFEEIFMDEIEKIAIAGTPLGRMIKTPKGRSGAYQLLRSLRRGESPAGGDPAKQRIMLAITRGGMEVTPPGWRERIMGRGTARTGPKVPSSLQESILPRSQEIGQAQVARELGKGKISKEFASKFGIV
jgi:hypothetical protein